MRCCVCGQDLEKIALSLCKKIFGLKSKKYYCMVCLSNNLEVSEDTLLEIAEDFKNQGCKLFQ